jgi:hypothetical protein
MAIHIRRREFVFTVGGAAVAWPLAARAQQGERMRRIGVLFPMAADDPLIQARYGAFLQGLYQPADWVTHGIPESAEGRPRMGSYSNVRPIIREIQPSRITSLSGVAKPH